MSDTKPIKVLLKENMFETTPMRGMRIRCRGCDCEQSMTAPSRDWSLYADFEIQFLKEVDD